MTNSIYAPPGKFTPYPKLTRRTKRRRILRTAQTQTQTQNPKPIPTQCVRAHRAEGRVHPQCHATPSIPQSAADKKNNGSSVFIFAALAISYRSLHTRFLPCAGNDATLYAHITRSHTSKTHHEHKLCVCKSNAKISALFFFESDVPNCAQCTREFTTHDIVSTAKPIKPNSKSPKHTQGIEPYSRPLALRCASAVDQPTNQKRGRGGEGRERSACVTTFFLLFLW